MNGSVTIARSPGLLSPCRLCWNYMPKEDTQSSQRSLKQESFSNPSPTKSQFLILAIDLAVVLECETTIRFFDGPAGGRVLQRSQDAERMYLQNFVMSQDPLGVIQSYNKILQPGGFVVQVVLELGIELLRVFVLGLLFKTSMAWVLHLCPSHPCASVRSSIRQTITS